MENNEIQSYEIQVRGEIPASIIDLWSMKQFCDFKIGYGQINFKGTETQLNDLLNDLSLDHADFKVIGVINKADTLIEISDIQNKSVTITDLFDQSKEYKTSMDNLLEILEPNDQYKLKEINYNYPRRFWVKQNKLKTLLTTTKS